MHDTGEATSLELRHDRGRQRQEWRFERIGWCVLALLIVAALGGAFGDGPLARASASAPAGARVDYERVVRYGTSTMLSLTLPPAAARDTMAVVTLDRAFLNAVDVDDVRPNPLETRASADRVEYHVRRAQADAPMRVDFTLKGTSAGWRQGRVGTDAGVVAIRQFVLP